LVCIVKTNHLFSNNNHDQCVCVYEYDGLLPGRICKAKTNYFFIPLFYCFLFLFFYYYLRSLFFASRYRFLSSTETFFFVSIFLQRAFYDFPSPPSSTCFHLKVTSSPTHHLNINGSHLDMVILTLGVDFTNILRAVFMREDPQKCKKD